MGLHNHSSGGLAVPRGDGEGREANCTRQPVPAWLESLPANLEIRAQKTTRRLVARLVSREKKGVGKKGDKKTKVYVKNDKGKVIQFGSIGGGGRYDNLVNNYGYLNVHVTSFNARSSFVKKETFQQTNK